MDSIDRAAIRIPSIPAELVHRYRHDPVFHKLVRVLLQLLQGEVQVGAADLREASIVADELRRELRVRERMEHADPAPCPARADRLPR